MKKIISILLVLAMLLSSTAACFGASSNKIFQILGALHIMEGDAEGNLNENDNLTRAMFAKMLVAASGSTTDYTSAMNFSLYTDVSKSHWARSYIYQATKKGLLTGYTDSSFKPDNNVKLEEVCSGVLKLLEYKASDLEGAFPYSYLNKADELGLLDNVTTSKGQNITRIDCARIFYNCLMASTSQGKVYGTTLGCTVSNGTVSYTSTTSSSTNKDGIYVGVVKSVKQEGSSSSNSGVASTVTVLCSDGVTRDFEMDKNTSYSAGKLVQVKVSSGSANVNSLSERSLTGTVNSKGTKVGDYSIAEDVGIIDADSDGNAVLVDVDDITGKSLSSSNVTYYSLDSSGKIDTLVLKDVTGKLWTKVYMTSVPTDSEAIDSLSGTYTYVSDGKSNTIRTSGKLYGVSMGGAMIKFSSSGEALSMKNLSSASLKTLTSTTAMYGSTKYEVSDDVQVYINSNGSYLLSDVDTVNDGQFSMTGWYETVGTSKTIYIIIATRISE